MDQIDIWATARALLDEHPNTGDAEIRCFLRIYALRQVGDVAGADTWGTVLRAVDELRRRGKEGEDINMR